jgi:tRNA nucleotidyltransferase/poly(A) polymerase
MSDYMFMLESHLTGAQSQALARVAAAAAEAGTNLFLAGGAIRDMLGGYAIHSLDFVLEAPPAKVGKLLERAGAQLIASNDARRELHLSFPGGTAITLAMSSTENYTKAGGKPQIAPAAIYDHLRCRDFTINAMAISLSRGSRGLLIDPNNGLRDLQAREIRTINNYSLYGDPARILRLLRLQTRLGFSIEERTQNQYRNVREAKLELEIPAASRRQELLRMAGEPNLAELIRLLEQERLLQLFSPALTGTRVNHAGFQKLQKAVQVLPHGVDLNLNPVGLALFLLAEKLTPKERTGLIQTAGLEAPEIALWQKIEARAKKLEKALAAPAVNRPSKVFAIASAAPGDEILFLLSRSANRTVIDRLKNYLQKYVLTAQEVTDAEVEALGLVPGTPKFEKARAERIAARLDARPKKVPVEMEPVPVPVATAARRFN